MDRMGVSGTLDIGSIPIRATLLKSPASSGLFILFNILTPSLVLKTGLKVTKIYIFMLVICKIHSNIAAPVWERFLLSSAG